MKLKLIILSLITLVIISGCNFAGLQWGNKGKYFQCTKNINFDSTKYNDIGVYVFSDGGKKNGRVRGVNFDEWQLGLSDILSFKWMYHMGRLPNRDFRFNKSAFPDGIYDDTEFEPDTINSGPSFELSDKISKKLNDLGYNASAITDMGHNNTVTLKQCLENAKKKGLQMAFFVYYSGVDHWETFISRSASVNTIIDSIGVFDGFLYLPNAAAYDVNTGKLLWSNMWYGLIQYAHSININGEPLNKCADKAIIYQGYKDYIGASEKAVDIIFNPEYFKDTFIPFPTKIPEQLKKRI